VPTYRVLVTDITNFGELRCVAGWDLDRSKMIRPEPSPGGFWPASKVAPNGPFELGKVAKFAATEPSRNSTDFPHRTEDRVVVGPIAAGAPPENHEKMLRDAAFASLSALFEENLVVTGHKAYIKTGTRCRSLGGLVVKAKGVKIETYNNYKNKQRLRLNFSDGTLSLAPNLTSSKAYSYVAANKLGIVNTNISKASELLLRIGLARGFPEYPDRCYLQVNGLSIL
jgi:hypothetical protein